MTRVLRRAAAAGLLTGAVLIAVAAVVDVATSPILPNPQRLPAFHTAPPSPRVPVELTSTPLPPGWQPEVAKALRVHGKSSRIGDQP